MTLRSVLIAVAACASVASMTALAHDPRLHEPAVPAQKAKPTTCTQLADVQRYSNDVADADIKALKARCDAEKKSAGEEKNVDDQASGR